MPKYECQNCGGAINSEYELVVTPNLICWKCFVEKNGDKQKTRRQVIAKYGNKCIVPGCPFKAKNSGKGLHLHRIIKGRDGGKYELDNCVLVCVHHHKGVEGKSLQEILNTSCTEKEIARMDVYNIAEDLLDYDFEIVKDKILEMCDDLGVPARCSKYDLVKAVENELRLANTRLQRTAGTVHQNISSLADKLSVSTAGSPSRR